MAMTAKKTVLIVDPLSKEALELLAREESVQVTECHGAELAGKIEAARHAHGILVRSGTRLDADFLENCQNLEIIVRAGVGVDNIDIPAATRKGVVVQNIPEGNIQSAAEHSIAMLLALCRNIPPAVSAMKEGRWDRKQFVGAEVQGKVLGIVGLGKIGRKVHAMATGMGMKVLGFDPFISPQVADDLGVRLLDDLGELVGSVDMVTVHVPLSPETRGLISRDVLRRARPGLRVVNCARGGIVDEGALLEALEEGVVRGAALDVYEKEPPGLTGLVKHPAVICTPHLGASTREAQQNVAIAAAQQVLDYFVRGELTSPVNAIALETELRDDVRPYYDLAYCLGAVQSQILEGNPSRVRVGFFGDLFENEIQRYLCSSVLQGFIEERSAQPVNAINAHHLASEMGLVVEEVSEGKSRYFHQMIKVRVTDSAGTREVGGTIRGQKGLRLVSLDDYQFDAVLEGCLLLVKNEDRPGMIGTIGGALAASDVNISYMTLGRDVEGGTAMALLNLDEPVPASITGDLESRDGILWARLARIPRGP